MKNIFKSSYLKLTPKSYLFPLAILLCLTIIYCTIAPNQPPTNAPDITSTHSLDPSSDTSSTQDELFESFTTNLFTNELLNSTLGLHYTLEHPEDYGIVEPAATFGTFETDSTLSLLAIENQKNNLATYNYQELNAENQLTYDILLEFFTQATDSCMYTLFYEPLAPYTGLHSQLPILLSEFPITSEDDIIIYLELLKAVRPYFESLVDYQIAKSAAGLFMSDTSLDSVIEDCLAFIHIPENYLLSTFDSRIQAIPDLSPEAIDAYAGDNHTIVQDYVIESYQYLVGQLELLRGTNTNELGLCYYENGRNYYNHLLQSNTGTSRTTSEVATLVKSQIEYDLIDLQTALLEESTTESTFFQEYNTPQAMLDYLHNSMDNLFPAPADVAYTIKEIPSELEDYLSPAFYLIPAIDSTTANTIYLNNAHMTDNLTLYTTLAHEGYPGHLYQTTYFQATDPDPIRSILNYGGYVEGWATYVEMCSYYMIDLPDGIIQQKNASLMLGLYAYTDIGIHSEGWTLADAVKFYKSYGITDTDAIARIFELVKATPTNYLKYYLGYVEFLELKKECIADWGDTFSQKRFHQEVLELGPTSFALLRKYMLE